MILRALGEGGRKPPLFKGRQFMISCAFCDLLPPHITHKHLPEICRCRTPRWSWMKNGPRPISPNSLCMRELWGNLNKTVVMNSGMQCPLWQRTSFFHWLPDKLDLVESLVKSVSWQREGVTHRYLFVVICIRCFANLAFIVTLRLCGNCLIPLSSIT